MAEDQQCDIPIRRCRPVSEEKLATLAILVSYHTTAVRSRDRHGRCAGNSSVRENSIYKGRRLSDITNRFLMCAAVCRKFRASIWIYPDAKSIWMHSLLTHPKHLGTSKHFEAITSCRIMSQHYLPARRCIVSMSGRGRTLGA